MNGTTTMTQKGQVAIPKSIRDYFHLQPHDKIRFDVRDEKIVATPAPTVDQMYGFFKVSKKITRKEMKKAIQEAVLDKFRRKKLIPYKK